MEIKLNKSSAIVFFLFAFSGKLPILISGYFAVFVHESLHLLACIILHEKPEGIFLDIWGMHLKTKSTHDTKKALVIWASGPIFSLFLSGVLFSLGKYNYFSYANFCVGIVNLLPVLPLDGGAILDIVLSHFFGTLKSDRIMSRLSRVICILFLFLCIYCIGKGILNVSFLIFTLMLIMRQRKRHSKSVIRCSEILTKKQISKKKIKLIFMDSGDDFMKVLNMISPRYTLFIAVFENEKFLGFLTQEDFLNIICESYTL